MRPEPLPPSARIRSVFGDREMGKSVFARELVRPWARTGCVAIYNSPNTTETDPFWGPEMSIREIVRGTRMPYAFALREEPPLVCEFALRLARAKRMRIALIVDEAWDAFPENFSQRSPAGRIFRAGRHAGIELIVVSQWPVDVSKRVIRASYDVFWFRMMAREDLWWVARRWGKVAAEQIYRLPKYQSIRMQKDQLPPGWQALPWPTDGDPLGPHHRSQRKGLAGREANEEQAGAGASLTPPQEE